MDDILDIKKLKVIDFAIFVGKATLGQIMADASFIRGVIEGRDSAQPSTLKNK